MGLPRRKRRVRCEDTTWSASARSRLTPILRLFSTWVTEMDLATHCPALFSPKSMMLSTAPPRLCKLDAVFTLMAGLRLRNERRVLMGGFHLFFLTFWLHHSAHEILVPQPGLELVAPAVEVQNLNHRTTRKILGGFYLYLLKLWLLLAFISWTFVLKIDCLKYFTKHVVLYFKQEKIGAAFQS